MSVNPQQTDTTDYSDFEYQFVNVSTQQSGGNGVLELDYEPLDGQGGLRPNQVAELVAVDLTVGVKKESTGGDTSTVDVRGVLGSNLDSRDEDPAFGNEGVSTDELAGGFGDGTISAISKDLPEVFIHYNTGSVGSQERMMNYRELVGRGPVIDANDDVSVLHTHVDEATTPSEATVTAHLIWDVFELDDARTEFSVPM